VVTLTQARPKTVPIVAIFLFVATAIAAVVGTSLLFPNSLLDRLWDLNRPAAVVFQALGRIAGVLLLVLGLGIAAAATGLLHRRRWDWLFAIALFAIDGAGDVLALFATGDLLRSALGVSVSATFLYSLTRPHVRKYFRHIV
jgi:cytochrome c biogenesis protein CcdA